MRARAFFRSSKLLLPGAIIGARFFPGLAFDLTHWRLMIDDEGNLYQDVQIVNTGQRDRQLLHVVIGYDAVLNLLLMVERWNSLSFVPPTTTYDDAAVYELAICYEDINTHLRVQGADIEADRGNVQMQRFMEVWRAVHRFAPVK